MSVTWTRTLSTANARKTNRRERGIRGRRVGVGGMRRGEKYTPSENMRRHRAAEGVVVHASSGAEVRSDSSPLERVAAVSDRISSLFPVFVAIASTVALHRPSTFSWFNGRMLIAGLCFTMLSMGTTLSPAQLLRAVRGGRKILAGVCLQYSIMPMLGYAMSKLAGLSPEHTAGIVLVSCCPGGVASNVVCYLAGADVPLSVALTSVSTILAVAMTPTLTSLLLGTSVAVDALGLFNSTLRVVLIPVLVGSLLSQKAPKVVAVLSAVAPAVSVIAVVFINASVVAQSASSILATGGKLVLACFILHSGGFALGYAVSRLGLKIDEKTSRTMSVEVGMQNSTLGAYLAVQHFSPLAAAPCAVSAVFHSGLGSLLAYIWDRSPIDEGTVHATTGGGNDNVEDVQKEDSLPPSFLNRTEEIDQERGE